MVNKTSRTPKNGAVAVGKLDMSSPATLKRFKQASKAYTLEAAKSKATATNALKRERIWTKSGKLAKPFAASKA